MDDRSKADSVISSFFNQYVEKISFYKSLLVAVENECHFTLAEQEISHFTESRVKDHQSLWKKLNQRKGNAQYSSVEDIEDDIVDVCGVRIIFHYPTDQHEIKVLLESIFDIQDVKCHSGGQEHTQNQPIGEWGYQLPLPDYIGTHYRGFVKPKIFQEHFEDLSAADRRFAAGTMIEIQVRSILDDIWARYAHSIYKSEVPTHESQGAMLRKLRVGLEGVREVTIEMQKFAVREEEESNRKFETNDEVGTCFRKLIKAECGVEYIDHRGVSSEALRYLLESIDKSTPGSLHKLIKSYNFCDGPDSKYEEIRRLYGPVEFNIVLYLIDRVLLCHNSQDEAILEKEAVPAKRKMQILMSTILWMDKLLRSSFVWKLKLASTPSQKNPMKGLEWLSRARQHGMLTKGNELDNKDKAILDELWNLFENHDQRPIKLAFAMSSRGMIRDVVRERQEVNRIIEELIVTPNFRSQKKVTWMEYK
ncbi:RelA/SpoT [Penicillium atrosanguineum]|uniref:RelA/SpoT n=1 Tax=Penicillium atrosanguineum TaxID=1132637 RepID=A0A9W9GQW0_9EURO|nr:hirsutellin A toxin [Penicillium atrosanguineum]KAJ5127418.1 RelA/SpoT [Penicillium atrosanguineum]KAJ5313904.1 hirsutellin A toxin [Penicillium atrosanguineum]KAJ5331075.1 RelA/SpoT [Penicillium atrosanguineum]